MNEDSDRTKKLIIIRGNSSSGKTTLAKTLQEELGYNTMIISQDIIKHDVFDDYSDKDVEVIELMIHLLRFGVKNIRYVIVEGIMNSDVYDVFFREAVKLYDENIHAYYFDLSIEETVRRHENSKKASWFKSKDLYRWWKDDCLSIIHEKRILKDMSIYDETNMILHDIGYKKASVEE